MIRINTTFDGPAVWHTVGSAHPGGLIRLDCELELAYQRVHVTTADVPPKLRCEGCETARLRAVDYFVARRTDEAVRSWEVE